MGTSKYIRWYNRKNGITYRFKITIEMSTERKRVEISEVPKAEPRKELRH
jgi:hypothetical protein